MRQLRWAGTAVVAMLAALCASGAALGAPGDLDPTFSGDGVWTSIVNKRAARDVLVQPDGSIVVVGRQGDALAITQVSADGATDSDTGVNATEAFAVVRQADGKLVVAGRTGAKLTVVRVAGPQLLTDSSFAGTGIRVVDLGAASQPDAAVLVQPDGKVVAVASSGAPNQDVAVVRLGADGQLDTTFGGDGIVSVDFGSSTEEGHAVVLQPDGKLVVAGSTGTDMAIARLLPDGSLDPSFDIDGRKTVDFFGDRDVARRVLLQPDGKLVLAGRSDAGADDVSLARLTPAGALDPSFDNDGMGSFDVGRAIWTGAEDAALLASGKLVLAATSFDLFKPAESQAVVVQLLPDGKLDRSFDGDGVKELAFGTFDVAAAVDVQSTGAIVFAGTTGVAPDTALAVARLVGEPPPPPAPPPPAPPAAPPPAPSGPLCNGRAATLVGTAGADRLKGTPGDDVIVALGGADVVDANGGNDVVCAGGGPDLVRGGAGDDALFGQAGKDDLRGGAGNDSLTGGVGPDTLRGGGGEDTCVGGRGADAGLGCEEEDL